MTKEETKKAIAVMQAYVDGKEIEVSYDAGPWGKCAEPCFEWGCARYRVKPDEIKKVYICISDRSGIEGYDPYIEKIVGSKESAEAWLAERKEHGRHEYEYWEWEVEAA